MYYHRCLSTNVGILIVFALLFSVSLGQNTTLDYKHNQTKHPFINSSIELVEFHYTSPGCLELLSCNSTEPFPQRRCHCDSLCNVMKDCCHDAEQDSLPTSYGMPKQSQYQCLFVSLVDDDDDSMAILLVAKCASS